MKQYDGNGHSYKRFWRFHYFKGNEGDAYILLYFRLDIVDRIRRLNVEDDGFPPGPHRDVHAVSGALHRG